MTSTMKIYTYKSNESHAGLSYGKWTVLWWKWALSIQADKNPVVDLSGKNAAQDQPKDVWFLAGIFGDKNPDANYPSRSCNIPSNMPILIPVINVLADSIEHPELQTDQDFEDYASKHANIIERKECYINKELIVPERVFSDPRVFDISIHQDYDAHSKGGNSRAAADGYWVFLKGLPTGDYSINFGGSCENGTINSGANYSLTIF